ncbi:RagB/SusD family nutrient uptake outer membrane protein [Spirosoma sp. KUDC1026]|uniref:RagB/SusD family nutrient uptake outer membrane protein n=1 Tax=Spirosoma sp. KUDC1026 TaxID=2745947 RepID=UPI00159BE2CD|nr:RagB/SusD family nutrient uptake outer membrane protein [Spirosoma sp. KUDC1026]QKZ13620.1 RagB/SusD family nutrient uptake outer membrane protein [Spirosoma sp. KUDC1026]
MKKITITLLALLAVCGGCNDDDFLNREPKNILLTDQIFANEQLTLSAIADLYDRYPDFQRTDRWYEFTNFDEAFASNFGDYFRHQNQEYNYDSWNYWDYGYLRDINLFIQQCGQSTALAPAVKDRFLAEARFIRAGVYFELVKRMGGVPLILEPLTYDFSGDATSLRNPRKKESEIYDFIISEMEAIQTALPDNPATKLRATKAAALALEARAALYAGSIARYGANTPQVSLPGGEVGIPAERATGYYQTALKAAQAITGYLLYQKNTTSLSDNFANLFLDKANNPEVIFAYDYKLKSGKVVGWTLDNSPLTSAEEGTNGGRLNPSLNLVQSFEKLDNTFAPLPIADAAGSPIYYSNPAELFAGRDARLAGTVLYPGSSFKGKPVDIWAGYRLGNGSVVTADKPGGQKTLPGGTTPVAVVGLDGPVDGLEFTAQSGFYVRKYMDPAVGSAQIGTQSEVWWVRYRYAEVLLNAAEAAFELGQKSVAADFMNQVRARAGLTKPLTANDITFDRIVHERKVELAFEGHELWDYKRWRLAHVVWNGVSADLTKNPGKADEPSTRVFGLWPYKVYNPGQPNDGKWVFQQVLPSRVTNAHRFRLGNYYSFISDEIRTNNPQIVRNPNQ